MATQINSENFDDILSTDKLVVIDFWAEWCGPCRRLSPIVEELAKDYEGKAFICKCDVDSNDVIAAKYGIRNIPTIIFLKNGEQVDKIVGAASKESLIEKINQHL